jgi:hypothetical protein
MMSVISIIMGQMVVVILRWQTFLATVAEMLLRTVQETTIPQATRTGILLLTLMGVNVEMEIRMH